VVILQVKMFHLIFTYKLSFFGSKGFMMSHVDRIEKSGFYRLKSVKKYKLRE